MFRILVADKLGQPGLDRLLAAPDVEVDVKTGLAKEDLIAVVGDYDALIVRSATTVDADVLEAATRMRVVGRAGAGVDNIDVRAATLRGVLVMNTPHANTVATAEQTVALMLAVSRNLLAAGQSVKAGKWERAAHAGIQLAGKTLGLIGFGRVGRSVASRAQAFGMHVMAYDPYVSEQVGIETGVTLVDLDDLLAGADYVSLHTALTSETENILDAAALDKAKDGVVIVNAARGGLVDEMALAEALRTGKVAAAGLDVFAEEPPPADHPLLHLDNVLATPHLGASTREAQRDVAIQIAEQVLDALHGRDLRNGINLPFSQDIDYAATLPYISLAERMGVLQFVMAPAPIRRVEVEVRGDQVERLMRPIASGLLKGILEGFIPHKVNYINAPVLAEEHGIVISQTTGITALDYPNLITCRIHWDGGSRLVSGVLFAGRQPRIVQISDYHMDANPTGIILLMVNDDVPGVVGQVGTLLGAHGVNIAEWRLGRNLETQQALSFINLDTEPSAEVMAALREVSAVTKAVVVTL